MSATSKEQREHAIRGDSPEIELIALDQLVPYARNTRAHSPENVRKLAASLTEYGWTSPVLINGENEIIAGHGRVLAAREVGMDKAPCIRLGRLTEAQVRAYRIADNQLALDSEWDMDLLKLELTDLDLDIALTGFEPDFDQLMGSSSLAIHGHRLPNNFPALLARDLMNEFCPNMGRVLDPWGGRMLGFLLSDKAAEYWGCDPAPQTSQGVQAMFDDLSALTPERKKDAKLFCSAFEITTGIERASFDFALTSPPYYDVEKYEGTQSSWCLYRNFDDWVAGFYQPLLARVSDALKPGAVFALQVGSQSYPLKELAIKLAPECGFRHVETRHTEMENSYNDTHAIEGEVIVMLERLTTQKNAHPNFP